jgi:hypothetical protein
MVDYKKIREKEKKEVLQKKVSCQQHIRAAIMHACRISYQLSLTRIARFGAEGGSP